MAIRDHSPAASELGFDIADALAADSQTSDLDAFDHPLVNKSRRQADSKNHASTQEVKDDDDDDDDAFIAIQQAASNRAAATAGKSGKKSGGFQSMGLNPNLFRAITRKGFSIPTPIQRKAIPLILDHQDVVGMARTGSGKTAAFVIPMIERLKMHSVKVGARAILLSPSRELALQTLKTVKEFGKGTDLRTILLVGGDSLEEQFSQMASNPDIVIATPGRFLHLIVEMSLNLSSVEYIVFDEADRLFEMGFASQLTEILHALPASRQTLLFSATLPKSLVDFAKAGLKDPSLVRLDAESKISPDLESAFLTVKPSDKEGALIHLLRDMIKVPPLSVLDEEQSNPSSSKSGKKRKRTTDSETGVAETTSPTSTIIFTATKYHVEYISTLLQDSGYSISFIYGNLDQTARKIQTDRFRSGRTNILVVTDIAARGIDIPLLANVINYDFPTQPKVFVHRVGRTARAGRKGWSYTLVQDSDVPYLLDLQLFLGKKLCLGRQSSTDPSFAADIVLGSIPTHYLEFGSEAVSRLLESSDDLTAMKTVAAKGEKQHIRSRGSASKQSAKRAKDVTAQEAFRQSNLLYQDDEGSAVVAARERMLATIGGFRPAETVFEIGVRGHGTETTNTIQRTRAKISAKRARLQRGPDHADGQDDELPTGTTTAHLVDGMDDVSAPLWDESITEDDEMEVTVDGAAPKSATGNEVDSWKDPDNYMGYNPRSINMDEDRAYGVHSGGDSKYASFTDAAREAVLDLGADESKSFLEASRPSQMRWDKRSKKYVARANDEDGSRGAKMIRGESGQKIAASFRSGRFDAWKKSHRLERLPRTGEVENARTANQVNPHASKRFRHNATTTKIRQPDKFRDDYFKQKKKLQNSKDENTTTSFSGSHIPQRGSKGELRGVEDVRKQRALKQKRQEKNARPARKRKE